MSFCIKKVLLIVKATVKEKTLGGEGKTLTFLPTPKKNLTEMKL